MRSTFGRVGGKARLGISRQFGAEALERRLCLSTAVNAGIGSPVQTQQNGAEFSDAAITVENGQTI